MKCSRWQIIWWSLTRMYSNRCMFYLPVTSAITVRFIRFKNKNYIRGHCTALASFCFSSSIILDAHNVPEIRNPENKLPWNNVARMYKLQRVIVPSSNNWYHFLVFQFCVPLFYFLCKYFIDILRSGYYISRTITCSRESCSGFLPSGKPPVIFVVNIFFSSCDILVVLFYGK